jgi:uncharacterized membrane protein YgcG
MDRIKRVAVVCALTVLWWANPSRGAVSAHKALNMVLPAVKLENVSLKDATDFLRDVTGANIHVSWGALETAGIAKDTQINIRLNSVSVRKVLDLMLKDAGAGTALAYYVDNGVLEVTTREIADKDLIVKLYPVEDLLLDTPDFQGPQINLSSSSNTTIPTPGQTGGGGSSSGQSLFGGSGGGSNGSGNSQQQQTTKAERVQALITAITTTIQPEVWQANGGAATISFWNGQLIVSAPRSVHEQLGGETE